MAHDIVSGRQGTRPGDLGEEQCGAAIAAAEIVMPQRGCTHGQAVMAGDHGPPWLPAARRRLGRRPGSGGGPPPIELAVANPVYVEQAQTLFEHFGWIAIAMNRIGTSQDSLWDDDDGFFYDLLRLPDGGATRLKVRSLVGLLPLVATSVIGGEVDERFPELVAGTRQFIERYPAALAAMTGRRVSGWAGVAAPWIVDDGWRGLVAPLLPSWPTRAPGPRPVDDRRCL